MIVRQNRIDQRVGKLKVPVEIERLIQNDRPMRGDRRAIRRAEQLNRRVRLPRHRAGIGKFATNERRSKRRSRDEILLFK